MISLLFNSLQNILDVDFLWKETRLRELMSSPGAPSTPSYSAGHSTPPSYSSGPSTPPSYSSGPSTPTNYSLGSSRNAECSNCKHLRGKIKLEASPGWVVNKDMSIEYLQKLVQRDEEMVQRLQALEREVEQRADEKLLFIEKLKRNVPFE
ncbi:hypothetical protein Tco_0825184 [Tanacetum coccineum]